MIDAVLGAHTNPLMSGVGAFNAQLAHRLGVPVYSLVDGWRRVRCPLVSIKAEGEDAVWQGFTRQWSAYDVFWHAGFFPGFTSTARRVYAANAALAAQMRPMRPDVISAHCPGLIVNRGACPQTDISVFAFGHSHKIHVERYGRLKALLDQTGRTYTIYLSAGLHVGAAAPDDPFLALGALFGDRLIFLGILSDRAVAHYLATSTYVACFFEHGLRENNTTVNAALDAGASVLTNCDAWTPACLRSAVIDLTDPATSLSLVREAQPVGIFDFEDGPYRDDQRPRRAAIAAAADAHSWARLFGLLR